MSDDISPPPPAGAKILSGLLRAHPEAVVAALGDDGFRVPMPASVDLEGHTAIPMPPMRSTMLDLVVAADRLTISVAWERSREAGGGLASARLSSDPDRLYTFGFIDARPEHGVWLATIREEGEAPLDTDGLARGAAVRVRPRTATMHKNMFGVFTAIDDRVTQMLGWTAGQMIGQKSLELGCYNRASAIAVLDEAMAADPPRPLAVVFIDLDNFKPVNDELGHAAGDELLTHVAKALAGVVRDVDIVGRIGGDEFLLVCPDIGRPEPAMAIADRVSEALTQQVVLASGVVGLSASIGVAWSSGAETGDEIVARADAAMYESKRLGAGRPILADPPDPILHGRP